MRCSEVNSSVGVQSTTANVSGNVTRSNIRDELKPEARAEVILTGCNTRAQDEVQRRRVEKPLKLNYLEKSERTDLLMAKNGRFNQPKHGNENVNQRNENKTRYEGDKFNWKGPARKSNWRTREDFEERSYNSETKKQYKPWRTHIWRDTRKTPEGSWRRSGEEKYGECKSENSYSGSSSDESVNDRWLSWRMKRKFDRNKGNPRYHMK